jgi:hypothetical protein
MSDALREAVARALTDLEIDNGEGGQYRLFELLDFSGENQTRIVIKAIADAALREAIPRIERETREACAKVAEEYGPSRPLAVPPQNSLIQGRWEGEQAASANIAAAIRGEPT